MDLGISLLTDDQLLELLQEACVELGNRDPFLRKMAQKVISDEAEQLKLKRQAIQSAVAKVKKRFIHELEQEAIQILEKEEKAGEYRPLSPKEEADHMAKITRQLMATYRQSAKDALSVKLQDEVHRDVLSGKKQIYSPEEAERMVADATESAVKWCKQHGVIPLGMFNDARKAIYNNLRKMGHSHDAIMAVYGTPEFTKAAEANAAFAAFNFKSFFKP